MDEINNVLVSKGKSLFLEKIFIYTSHSGKRESNHGSSQTGNAIGRQWPAIDCKNKKRT